jgi:L-lactate dehydrogenase complex protein LldG
MSPRPAADNASAREAIMARVREALRVPAPLPHLKGPPPEPSLQPATGQAVGGAGPSLPILAAERARPWLPDGGDSPEESLAILVDNLEKLRAVVWRVSDVAAAAERLAAEAEARGWQQIAWHADPLVAQAVAGLACETYRVDAESEAGAGGAEGAAGGAEGVATCDKEILEACDAGISGCGCLVAQTGSILVSSAAGGRGISILPHVHVVIARLDQIVPTLADALAGVPREAGGGQPSMRSLITGPSRTGDIERILVLGAHGPKELLVILVGELLSGSVVARPGL